MDKVELEKVVSEFRNVYDGERSYKDTLDLIYEYGEKAHDAMFGKEIEHFGSLDCFYLSRMSCGDSKTDPWQIFQFYNKEFNDVLSEQLKHCKLVIEVGAGDGLLTKVLKDRGVNIIATDDNSWELQVRHPVEKLGYKAALEKYKPDFVLVSWMPYKIDWTLDFRRCQSVKEYIVIGEGRGGCVGNDRTWQNHKGWKQEYLNEVDKFGIVRTDHIMSKDHDIFAHTTVVKYTKL